MSNIFQSVLGGLSGLLNERSAPQPGILEMLARSLPQNQIPDLFGNTAGGAAHINPRLLAQANRYNMPKYGALAALLDNFNRPGISDSAIPDRLTMRIPSYPYGYQGIHAWPFPGASMPNVFRGTPTPPGSPGIPDAPEYYLPGSGGRPNTWQRGT